MKLEVGKRYVCRNGEITGPMQENGNNVYPYMADGSDGLLRSWTAEGHFWRDKENNRGDITSEYVEPPALTLPPPPPMPTAPNRLTLPTDSEARKDVPLYSGCYAYFPAALAGVAKHSKTGNDKHNPGQPIHHARGKSNDHQDCIARHLSDLGDLLAYAQREPYGDSDLPLWEMNAKILEEANALCWRALAFSQELHERYAGAPLAPGARLPDRSTDTGACRACEIEEQFPPAPSKPRDTFTLKIDTSDVVQELKQLERRIKAGRKNTKPHPDAARATASFNRRHGLPASNRRQYNQDERRLYKAGRRDAAKLRFMSRVFPDRAK